MTGVGLQELVDEDEGFAEPFDDDVHLRMVDPGLDLNIQQTLPQGPTCTKIKIIEIDPLFCISVCKNHRQSTIDRK